jgi:pimeloyl-ACP methyl ester carboxylesterase
MPVRTRYVEHRGARIAYQVVGTGPVDLLVVPGFISHLHLFWAMPKVAAMYHRLASFSRLILFDKAGTGVSDPIAHVPTLEERMDEVNAVLDAAGSRRTALLGLSEGGLMSLLFAATYPERTLALALYGAFPCGAYDDEFPEALRSPVEHLTAEMFDVVDHWGDGKISGDRTSWNLGFFERAAVNRAMARGMVEVGQELDLRPVLGAIHVPTVVVHRSDDPFPIGVASWMADRIPGARFVELPGDAHQPWRGDMDSVVDAIEEVVLAAPRDAAPDRALRTVVTARLARDPAADDAARSPDGLVREQLERFGGSPVTTGTGALLAAFDGPERAVRCAHAIVAAGPELSAGVHTGECDTAGGAASGRTLEVSARLAELGRPGEVLVSDSVKKLVVGSGLAFGPHEDEQVGSANGRVVVHVLATSDGAPAPSPDDPALAVPPEDSLTRSERLRLAVARHAPGLGRLASRGFGALRAYAGARRR